MRTAFPARRIPSRQGRPAAVEKPRRRVSGEDQMRHRVVYSFVVDDDPLFAYQAWHLARSLVERCDAEPSSVHVQCTPEVGARTRAVFAEQGYAVHGVSRFGDGRYCNKLTQLESLRDVPFDAVVLLDTDTIAVDDLRPYVRDGAVTGKIVDFARPPLATLRIVAHASGLEAFPAVRPSDAGDGPTFDGNCNGGFYAVPRAFCETLSAEWRSRALWLLDHADPLRASGHEQHVDQVAFCLAVAHAGLPFEPAPSNANYFVHVDAPHGYLDAGRDIALLHYHGALNVAGVLEPPAQLVPQARAAVERANAQIARNFENRVFWDMRYRRFPERGSGVGSRGELADYKRTLLREHGAESAPSVLDVGCGDLVVVAPLAIRSYVGIDVSEDSLATARRARPDWEFRLAPAPDVAPADLVLCFEVLIHQRTADAYRDLVEFLASRTRRTLLVSGFDSGSELVDANPILFFHEPLAESLRRTGRFGDIRRIGSHTGVTVYRCDVAA